VRIDLAHRIIHSKLNFIFSSSLSSIPFFNFIFFLIILSFFSFFYLLFSLLFLLFFFIFSYSYSIHIVFHCPSFFYLHVHPTNQVYQRSYFISVSWLIGRIALIILDILLIVASFSSMFILNFWIIYFFHFFFLLFFLLFFYSLFFYKILIFLFECFLFFLSWIHLIIL
jgi:hypothetical protein